jgi:sulfite reductase (NADPH) hemoprotein beta-component
MSFLQRESRFLALHKKDPEVAEPLWQAMNKDVHHRMDHLLQLSADYKSFDHPDDAAVMTLFASETGTAARAARDFSSACTLSSTASAMDDIEVDELDGRTTVFFISTCGQGAMPQNGRRFLKDLQARKDYFKEGTCFMVFGLGDSSYFFYVKAAKEVESRMVELGAKQILPLGAGDDLAEEGMEEGLHDWLERVWPSLELSPPSEVPHITPVHALFSERALMRPEDEQRALAQFIQF